MPEAKSHPWLPSLLFVVGMFVVFFWPVRHLAAALPWASGILFFSLLICGLIDIREQRLPDVLTLPLAGLGVAFSAFSIGIGPLNSIAGLAVGYGLIAGLRLAWLGARHIEAIGLGDAKLLAALGAWLGVAALPEILLLASGAGLLAAIVVRLAGQRHEPNQRIAFGPFLAVAGWLGWWAGPKIVF